MEKYIIAHVDSAWLVLCQDDDGVYIQAAWLISREECQEYIAKKEKQEETNRLMVAIFGNIKED